jgi:hypothetical protein
MNHGGVRGLGAYSAQLLCLLTPSNPLSLCTPSHHKLIHLLQYKPFVYYMHLSHISQHAYLTFNQALASAHDDSA